MTSRRAREAASRVDDSQAIDTAWRVHQAQMDWTGKVDAKATFAFAIESAAIATIVGLTSNDRLYSDLDEWWLVGLYAIGLTCLLLAAGCAALVVIPRLRSKEVAKEARRNFIYFGHARLWEPDDLARALRHEALLPQLARQITAMADIAWTKHQRVQWSFRLAIVGGLAMTACGLGTLA